MATLDKPLGDLTEADFQALVENGVAECKTIEYKQELPGNGEEQKKEFLADVSSFANASGGHLIFGVAAKDGVPTSIAGLDIANPDGEVLRLDNMVRSGIQPRIPGHVTRPLALSSGRTLIVMHIPQSWASPHMVTFKDWSRFYSRASNGKSLLDVGEIRAAFLRSASFADRVRDFRADRLAKIAAGETPYQMPDTAKIALHLVPFSAFDPGALVNLSPSQSAWQTFLSVHPISTRATTHRYNFDGLMFYQNNTYVQVFRNGAIEAVDATLLDVQKYGRQIPSARFEGHLVKALGVYLALQQHMGVGQPILVMLTLLGVRGYSMEVRETLFAVGPKHAIDRDTLVVPEELVESIARAPEDILRHAFDAVWNATGWSRSMNYDDAGNWSGPKDW